MTGPASWAGISLQNGARLHFDEVNEAGGVNGRKIEIIVEDTQCLPSNGLAAVKKLIDRDKIFAVFGGVCSNAILAVVPLVKETKIPFFDLFMSHPVLTTPVIKNVFRVGSIPSDMHAHYMVDFAVQHFKAKKIAIVNQSDEFGKYGAQYIQERMGKEYGLKPIAHEVYNLGDVDFVSQIMRLKQSAPDVILLYAFPKEAAILLRQSKELGLKGQWVGSMSIADRSFTKLAGEAAAGSVHLWNWGPYLDTDDSPPVIQFKEKYDKKYPGHPPGKPHALDMAAYASSRVFVEGLRRAGKDLSREGFIGALESIKDFDSGLMGRITFIANDHQGNKSARFVKNQPDGKRVLLGVVLGGE
jgi:branched-chain amino acid transport system substrate-binding protein